MTQAQHENPPHENAGDSNPNYCKDGIGGTNDIDDFDIFLNEYFKRTHTYIDNDNFSAVLLEKLPVHKKLTQRQEQLIVIVPLVIISVLVLNQFSWAAMSIKCWVWLGLVSIETVFQWSLSAFILVLLGIGYWLCKQYRFI